MKKAALYARVSSEAQQKERTIESQVVQLKRQIADTGHALVKEYIDDGYSGARLDRPGLEQLRKDVKTGLFDAIYFLNTDRIARDTTYQTIIVGELLKHGKQIFINGRDYVNNPENKFTLTVLGAVSELERAKIIERTTRGRLHRIRSGQIAGQAHCIYGYDYVKKSPLSPPALVIKPREAEVVRSIFEAYASGTAGISRITRSLEERGLLTRKGKRLWRASQIRRMLGNHTYAGIRYFNMMTAVKDGPGDIRPTKRGKVVYRDRAEWIAVKVPAIVSQELFDKAQERMQRDVGFTIER